MNSTSIDENNVKPKSSYLDYLPALYRSDEFMGRFLLIFESILGPIENTVNNTPLYFDPKVIPEPMLPWLASWVDLVLDPRWPEEKRRELVRSAAELYRWRGTKRGLSEYLRIYTGSIPEVTEYVEGVKLGPDAKLGVNTQLGSVGGGNHFTVSLNLDGDDTIDIDTIKTIIESQKPAHTIYSLHIKGSGPKTEDSHGS